MPDNIDVKIEYTDISPEQFKEKLQGFNNRLENLFNESREIERDIKKSLAGLRYE